jgi:hypothetical protein
MKKNYQAAKIQLLNIHATVIQENPKIQVLIEVQLTRNKRTNMAVKIQVLVKLEKNIKVVKIHLKTMLVLKMQLLMKMQLIRNRRTNLTVKIQVLVKLEKNVKVVKRASEDDYGSEDVSADGSATNEEHQVKADYEDSSASENGKNIKVVKVHLKTTLALKMYVLMELQLLRNKRINLTVQIQVLVKMKKKRQGSKNASEDDAGSEDASANGSATIEEQEDKSDCEDSSANGNGKKVM